MAVDNAVNAQSIPRARPKIGYHLALLMAAVASHQTWPKLFNGGSKPGQLVIDRLDNC
jgi:hypothetical protein